MKKLCLGVFAIALVLLGLLQMMLVRREGAGAFGPRMTNFTGDMLHRQISKLLKEYFP